MKYMIEQLAKASKIHHTNLLLYPMPFSGVCGSVLIFNLLHYHWKFGHCYIAIAFQYGGPLWHDTYLGLLFDVVYSSKFDNLLLPHRNFNHIVFCDLLPLHCRYLWLFSFLSELDWGGLKNEFRRNQIKEAAEIQTKNWEETHSIG